MKNRWTIAASAVGIHISIGSVYAWSVMSKPMMAEFGWSLRQVSRTFSIAIFFLGLSAAFLGRFVQQRGPRVAGMLSAVMFGAGLLTAAAACHFRNLWLLYLGYGVMGGIGIGIGYITPIATLLQWFPDRKGLATGIAIMGFGFASLICGPLSQMLMQRYGLAGMFAILAAGYFTLIFVSSLHLSPPPLTIAGSAQNASTAAGTVTVGQALSTARFYLLWLIFFINITCGIGLISTASPLAQEQIGINALAAAALVGCMGIFNGLGRFGWSALSDYIGRRALWVTFFIIQIAAFLLLGRIENRLAFQAVLCLIITCYGGGFASLPAFLSDIFGVNSVSRLLGLLLTAWSAAGLLGPLFIARVREMTGTYQAAFYIFAGMFMVGLILLAALILTLKKPLKS
ncbi:MAG: OFA family MFS transporter [Planctomycetaceae bacterium]|nr:OFA family MFS transporter [Planctomycetaceae bacterium]